MVFSYIQMDQKYSVIKQKLIIIKLIYHLKSDKFDATT